MITYNTYVTKNGVRIEDRGTQIRICHTSYLGDTTINKEDIPEMIEALQKLRLDEEI